MPVSFLILSAVSSAAGTEVFLELLGGAGADEHGRDAALAEDPAEGVLGQGAALGLRLVVPLPQLTEQLGGEHLVAEEFFFRHARILRDALQIAVGEQSLRQGREGDEAHAVVGAEVEDALLLRLAVEHVEASLIDEQWDVALTQIVVGRARGLEGPSRDADVEGLARADDVDEGLEGLLERRQGVVAVGIEQVDIVEMHAAQALVERGHEILARAPVAVGAGPHVVAGLGGDEELVAIGPEVVVHEPAEGLLGRAVDGPVVVGQVHVGDAVVEGIADDLARALVGVDAAEVMPEPEAHAGQQHAALPASLKRHAALVVAALCCLIHKS